MNSSAKPPSGHDASEAALQDELLAIRCQLGEPDALNELVERWHEPLWRYVRRMTGDDDAAAESLQDTWLRVLRGLPVLRDPKSIRPWLFGIARRVLMDRLRRAYAEPESVDLEADEISAADSSDELREELHAMYDALGKIPVIEREVLVLFYLEELSLSQVADVLTLPIGTVKSRLFRARRLLRSQITSAGASNR